MQEVQRVLVQHHTEGLPDTSGHSLHDVEHEAVNGHLELRQEIHVDAEVERDQKRHHVSSSEQCVLEHAGKQQEYADTSILQMGLRIHTLHRPDKRRANGTISELDNSENCSI